MYSITDTEAWLIGRFLSVCRYDHFRDKPAALMVKMAEFIMAALTDDLNKQYNDGVFEQHRPSEMQA